MKKFNNNTNLLGSLITAAREKQKMTKTDLCLQLELVGVEFSRSEIYRIEKNQMSVKDFELIAFCLVLDISFSQLKDFFNYPEDMNMSIDNGVNEDIQEDINDGIDKDTDDDMEIDTNKIVTEHIDMNKEMLIQGNINTITGELKDYLTNLSNRDYLKFDEKYVKLLFYAITRNLGTYYVKTEVELGGKYSDLLLIPTKKIGKRYGILIEFKYIKKEKYKKNNNLLEQKQREAREQLKIYKNTQEIKMIPKIKCYSIVAIKNKIYVEEIE